MKRMFVTLLVAAAAAVACTEGNFAPDSTGTVQLRFKIESEATRSLLTDDYHICWEAGKDEVSLFSKTENNRLAVTADGTSTWLEGSIGSPSTQYYALYPYDPAATNATGFLTTTIPSAQKAVRGQFSNMVAVAFTKTDELRFRNCVTLVGLDLQTDGVNSISFKGNNGELIAGTLRISVPTKDENEPVTTVIAGSKEVSISDGGAILEKGMYYVGIIPTVFSKGVSITLSGPGGVARKFTTKSVTASRSKRLLTGPLALSLVPEDDSFSLSYDDAQNSGVIYPGEDATLIYSYSGVRSFSYKVNSAAGFTQECYLDGSTSPADASSRIGSGFSASSGAFDLQPCPSEGGGSPRNAALSAKSTRGSESAPIDLSTDPDSHPGVSLGGANTANCYIVRAPGWYSLPLVWGNAIKGGSANTAAYAPSVSGGSALSPFVDGTGAPISSPWINSGSRKAASARLEWEDSMGLVRNVSLDSSGNGCLIFEVPTATIREGNAVLSVLDADGRVLWSWHIWVSGASDSEFAPVAVSGKTGKEYGMLGMHLGWVHPGATTSFSGRSTKVRLTENGSGKVIEFTLLQTPGNIPAGESGFCPFYQWGRKDPFPAGDGTTEQDASLNFRKKTWYTTERRDTVGTRAAVLGNSPAAFIANPSVYNISSGGDNSYYNAWNATQTAAGSTDSIVKTIYDPCPPGYSMPPQNAFSTFTKDNSSGDFAAGWNFYSRPSKGGSTIFFPAVGSMSTSNSTSTSVFAALRNVGTHCSCWSGNPNQLNSAYYLMAMSSSVSTSYGSNRQYVYPVRPIVEQ